MAMRQRALNVHQRLGGFHGDTALEQDAEMLDELRISVRQIGQGAFDDLATFAIALTLQDRGRRVSVRDGLDIHGLKHRRHSIQIKT